MNGSLNFSPGSLIASPTIRPNWVITTCSVSLTVKAESYTMTVAAMSRMIQTPLSFIIIYPPD